MKELKDCPFCGGEACAINEKIGCRIVCRECGASVPDQPIWYPEAVKKWNHRHLTSTMRSDNEGRCDFCEDTKEIPTPDGPAVCPHCR